MGFVKVIIIILVLIIALKYFTPDIYNSAKDTIVPMIMGPTDEVVSNSFSYTGTDYGLDYGLIAGVVECTNSDQCEKYFRMDQMACSDNGTCYIPNE